jgi:hypothetical protein
MRFLNSKWGKYSLSWFWSDRYWYVTATNKRHREIGKQQKWPIGSGSNKDEAFNEFRDLLGV